MIVVFIKRENIQWKFCNLNVDFEPEKHRRHIIAVALNYDNILIKER